MCNYKNISVIAKFYRKWKLQKSFYLCREPKAFFFHYPTNFEYLQSTSFIKKRENNFFLLSVHHEMAIFFVNDSSNSYKSIFFIIIIITFILIWYDARCWMEKKCWMVCTFYCQCNNFFSPNIFTLKKTETYSAKIKKSKFLRVRNQEEP